MRTLSKALDPAALRGFSGTSEWHRWSPLFPHVLLTDGTLYVAEQASAFWLMDAIASWQPTLLSQHEWASTIQFWQLTVRDDRTAVLTCREDQGITPVVNQEIEYTDFPLPHFDLWVGPLAGGNMTILLPSEY